MLACSVWALSGLYLGSIWAEISFWFKSGQKYTPTPTAFFGSKGGHPPSNGISGEAHRIRGGLSSLSGAAALC
jgi:hypothetical protein